MNRRILLGIAVILITTLILTFAYFIGIPPIGLPADYNRPTPMSLFTANTSVINAPMIANDFSPEYYTNVTQGSELQINVTVTSTGPEELVFIRDIQVWWYNSKINLYTWESPPIGNGSIIQASAFNYTSSPNPISLQKSMSNSTIIVLNINKDAPTGQYSMYINLEAETMATPAPNNYFVLNGSYWFSMIINPS